MNKTAGIVRYNTSEMNKIIDKENIDLDDAKTQGIVSR